MRQTFQIKNGNKAHRAILEEDMHIGNADMKRSSTQ